MPRGSQSVTDQRRELPAQPGVYLFRDESDRVLYVGKAKSIRSRVNGHFSKGSSSSPDMARRTARIEFIVTQTEAEALLAEQQFIKRHRPPFNIRLRDDKSYPYIAISLDEDFPRVYFTRERHRTGRAYFGPYSSAKRVRQTLDLLGKLFQYRTCEGQEPGRKSGSPCLDYYIKRCGAPCVGYIDREEYRRGIEAIADFLSGRYKRIEQELDTKMRDAAAAQEFEQAAVYRNRLRAVRALLERQRVAGDGVGTADLIGVAVDGTDANAQVFQVRDRILAERHGFYLENEGRRGLGEVAEEFVLQYYEAAPHVPRLVVVGSELAERAAVIAEALSRKRGARVEVRVAERGDKRRLRELAERNARLALDQDRLRREHRRQRRVAGLSSLQEALELDSLPMRIEGFDISNLGETHTVASMVVFEGGAPKKAHYRRFRIRGERVGGPDDFASMREVLARRMARHLDQVELSPHDDERDGSFSAMPDLVVIDGGKGQLSAGVEALEPLLERGVRVIGLAKRIEEIFLPGRPEPIVLSRTSDALQLLQRVRDEAHRFAIDHHRGRRDKAMKESFFDELPGVGPARKRALLTHFGSPEAVLSASRDELEAVPGIPGKLAREIHEQLHRVG